MSLTRFLLLLALVVAANLASISRANADSYRWDGTSPFCSGECGPNETEVTRASTSPGSPPAYNGPQFGAACATGTKALCLASAGYACRWDGTAPFCDGSCRGGESPGEPPQGSSSGSSCVTGSKVYCCHSTTHTVSIGQRLSENPKLVRYAAFWEKTAGPGWQARHGLTSAQYQQEFNKLSAQGYRLVEVSGYGVGGTDYYAAVWEQRPGPAWQARHGLTAARYQEEFDKLTSQGYRPINVSGYTVAGQDRYAAIFEQRQGPAWVARHNLSSAQYQQEFDRLSGQGYRLIDVSGYEVGGNDRYAAIWEHGQGPAWQARHGLTAAQYQAEFNRLSQQGYKLARIRGWTSNGEPHFAAIWVKVDGGAWIARHGILADSYQEEFDKNLKDGYRLKHVSGYQTFN